MNEQHSIPKPCPIKVHFKLGLNTISADGDWNDSEHPHVLRLNIIRSSFNKILIFFLLALPPFIRQLAETVAPGYFLPSRIILKKMKPGWDDQFKNEIRVYPQLKAVQGHLIPEYLGLVQYDDGMQALLLSEIDGMLPFEQPLDSPLELSEFLSRLEVAFNELGTFGLFYDDPKLDNCLLVEDRIMIIDLESVLEAKMEGSIDLALEANLEILGQCYKVI